MKPTGESPGSGGAGNSKDGWLQELLTGRVSGAFFFTQHWIPSWSSFFFFFFLLPLQCASAPSPQSSSEGQITKEKSESHPHALVTFLSSPQSSLKGGGEVGVNITIKKKSDFGYLIILVCGHSDEFGFGEQVRPKSTIRKF